MFNTYNFLSSSYSYIFDFTSNLRDSISPSNIKSNLYSFGNSVLNDVKSVVKRDLASVAEKIGEFDYFITSHTESSTSILLHSYSRISDFTSNLYHSISSIDIKSRLDNFISSRIEAEKDFIKDILISIAQKIGELDYFKNTTSHAESSTSIEDYDISKLSKIFWSVIKADLAYHPYNDIPYENILKKKYDIIFDSTTPEDKRFEQGGFRAKIIREKNSGRFSVCISGSKFKDDNLMIRLYDFIDDLAVSFLIHRPICKTKIIDQFIEQKLLTINIEEIDMAGHSLGGFLSSYMSKEFISKYFSVYNDRSLPEIQVLAVDSPSDEAIRPTNHNILFFLIKNFAHNFINTIGNRGDNISTINTHNIDANENIPMRNLLKYGFSVHKIGSMFNKIAEIYIDKYLEENGVITEQSIEEDELLQIAFLGQSPVYDNLLVKTDEMQPILESSNTIGYLDKNIEEEKFLIVEKKRSEIYEEKEIEHENVSCFAEVFPNPFLSSNCNHSVSIDDVLGGGQNDKLQNYLQDLPNSEVLLSDIEKENLSNAFVLDAIDHHMDMSAFAIPVF